MLLEHAPGFAIQRGTELLAEFEFTVHIRARGEEVQAIKREAGYKAPRSVVNVRSVG
jgi:hypothetical protein